MAKGISAKGPGVSGSPEGTTYCSMRVLFAVASSFVAVCQGSMRCIVSCANIIYVYIYIYIYFDLDLTPLPAEAP